MRVTIYANSSLNISLESKVPSYVTCYLPHRPHRTMYEPVMCLTKKKQWLWVSQQRLCNIYVIDYNYVNNNKQLTFSYEEALSSTIYYSVKNLNTSTLRKIIARRNSGQLVRSSLYCFVILITHKLRRLSIIMTLLLILSLCSYFV